ncbi:unnamed protein product [Phaeothamnion confervicola]
MATTVPLKTTPPDSRFPTTNQAAHCWNLYNQWVLALKKADGDESNPDSLKTRQAAASLCPIEWVRCEEWPLSVLLCFIRVTRTRLVNIL